LITKESYLISKEELSEEINRLQEQYDTANIALKEQTDLTDQVSAMAKKAEDIKYLKSMTMGMDSCGKIALRMELIQYGENDLQD
jgi:predicted RNA-binding protein with EMAP domain